jgi:hypothetical protein
LYTEHKVTWRLALTCAFIGMLLSIVLGTVVNLLGSATWAASLWLVAAALQVLAVGSFLGSRATVADGGPLGFRRASMAQLLTLLAFVVVSIVLSLMLPQQPIMQ